MADPMPNELAVTDADREMAVDITHAIGMDCEEFTGEAGLVLVKMLARHRADATAPLVEAARRLTDAIQQDGEGNWFITGDGEILASELMTALAPYKATGQ